MTHTLSGTALVVVICVACSSPDSTSTSSEGPEGAGATGAMGGTGTAGGGGSNPAGAGGDAAGTGGDSGGAAGGLGGSAGSNPGGGGGQAGAAGGGSGVGGAGGAMEFAWTLASPCPIARFEANTAVVGAELWVMGGFTSANLAVTRRVDVYDPEADSWRRGPDLPGAETHVAVITVDGDIIIAGGFAGSFTGSRPPPTEAVHRLNVATGEWVAGPTLPTRGAGFAWALVGTKFHVASGLAADGNSDANTHYVWNLAGPAEWTTAASLPNARNHGGGAAAGGLFYAIAGRHGWNEQSGAVADAHAFDPVDGTWTPRAAIPGARSEIGASTMTLSDGRILVIGGSLPGIVPSDDVLIYDPAPDAWSSLPSLPEPRKGAVAAQIGRRIVVTTGSPTSVDPSATTFIGCCL